MSVASGDSKASEGSEKKKPFTRSEGSNENGSREGARREGGYGRDNFNRDGFNKDRGDFQERIPTAAMEVTVENNIERAMKVLRDKKPVQHNAICHRLSY